METTRNKMVNAAIVDDDFLIVEQWMLITWSMNTKLRMVIVNTDEATTKGAI